MAGLVVAGTTIPIAASGQGRHRDDRVDRSRALDGSMHATQIGTAKRSWVFVTPALLRADSDTYEAILAVVPAQTCSGDVLGTSVSCFAEITDWQPVTAAGSLRVVLTFALHEA